MNKIKIIDWHPMYFQEPDLRGRSVYISGSISSDPNWRGKFIEWEIAAVDNGARIIYTPRIFPAGWTYEAYMEHCLLMVRHAQSILMIPGWEESKGARAEHAYAESLGREIIIPKRRNN